MVFKFGWKERDARSVVGPVRAPSSDPLRRELTCQRFSYNELIAGVDHVTVYKRLLLATESAYAGYTGYIRWK